MLDLLAEICGDLFYGDFFCGDFTGLTNFLTEMIFLIQVAQ